jgi:hypothetical protein
MMSNNGRDFYLHLISDASLNYFPSNVISEFTTKLPHEVDLPGSWQVALCNIAYQKTWGNISTEREGKIRLKLYQKTSSGPKGIFEPKLKVQGVLDPGHYATTEALIKSIYDKFEGLIIWDPEVVTSHKWTTFRLRDVLDISPQQSNNKLAFAMKENPYHCHALTLSLSPTLANLMGHQEFTTGGQRNHHVRLALNDDEIPKTKALNAIINLNSGINSLFCYTSLVRNTIVGDTQVPLLRIVPVHGSDGDYIYETFEDRQYLPLASHRFSTVQVLIGDRLGNRIKFSHGSAPVIMVLHFSRKQ